MVVAHVREVDARGLAVALRASKTAVWLVDQLRRSKSEAEMYVRVGAAMDENADLHGTGLPAPTLPAPTLPDAAPDPAADPDPATDDDAESNLGPVLPPGIRSMRDAVTAGLVSLDQADVIRAVLKKVPRECRAQVETFLIVQAQIFNPKVLAQLGDRIFHLVDPAKAEELEAKALEDEEKKAYAEREVRYTRRPGGGMWLTARLGKEEAENVRLILESLCSPRNTGGDDKRTLPQRRADALADVFRWALNAGKAPSHGGNRTQVLVTIPYQHLLDGLGAGTFTDGTRISATMARRLACDAGLIPAVLNGKGLPLDIGRAQRLFLGPLRRALVLRDRGCAFPGCDRPPEWCEGHHPQSWLDNGKTSLTNGVLLCSHHHGVVHNGGWDVRINRADGFPEFLPPPWIDPTRRPRRNIYHHPAQAG
jgi:hypothetical protein